MRSGSKIFLRLSRILLFASLAGAGGILHLPYTANAAQEPSIPQYDTEKLCDRIADGTPDANRAKKLCLSLEMQQLQRIPQHNVTSGEFSACVDQEKLGSYFSLNTCLNESAHRRGQSRDARSWPNQKQLPAYDIGNYCKRAANAAKGSRRMEMDCRMKE
ncbi:MAG: hypothetical protein IKS68_02365, partial [Mailhella sp.]|nr:hypothetical protein [Mailhella sp.]